MYNYDALALLLADAAVLAVIILQPLSRHYDDSDRGRGTVVKLPPFGRQSLPRAGIFLVVAAAVGSLVVIDRHPSVTELYHQALLRYIGCNAETDTLAALFGDEMALRQQGFVTALRQYLRVLGGAAVVEGVDLEGADTPLVQ